MEMLFFLFNAFILQTCNQLFIDAVLILALFYLGFSEDQVK